MATEKALVKAAPSAPVMADPEKVLAKYREAKYNLVVASSNIHITDPRMMVEFKMVPVDGNPDNGEVYETAYRSGKYALSKSPLERISMSAGVVWDPRLSGFQKMERDFSAYKAVGHMRSDSGETITLMATNVIDMEVVEDESRAEQTIKVYNKNNENYKTWNRKIMYEELDDDQRLEVDRLTKRECISFKKKMHRRCETCAKLAAIRSIGLKSSYTPEELKKPFIIVRVVPNPDDPMVRASMRAGAMALYGGGSTRQEQEEIEAEDAEYLNGTATEPETEGEDEAQEQETAHPSTSAPDPSSTPFPNPNAPPAPASDGSNASHEPNPVGVALEQEARRLNRYREFIRHIGTNYGVTRVSELDAEQIAAASEWLRASKVQA